MRHIFIKLIQFYCYFISPWLGQNCRYTPVCSHYCIQALEEYGVVSGLWFGLCRIIRCHPGCGYGYDPVPDMEKKNG